ncbi:RNA polymerase sigma factor SigJ [Streptomyces sp. NPDC026666]|uniref:RNA polymerase sigma factor SigJ n=1 Tax=Streptomyces sp. NPDC026666 TaxID=3154799 RepID=UPI0034521B88
MTTDSELARAYDRARPRLVRVAYAVLGSHAEAEDVVADMWPRLLAAHGGEPVRNVEAWAVTAVSRHALDVLRSARHRRETYVGVWLPEPLLADAATAPDPADRVAFRETVSYAVLVVLETLTPAERTAWVLHDVFGTDFNEVAVVVGRSPAAVRQLAARARKHIAARVPRTEVDTGRHRAAVEAFTAASRSGDVRALLAVLDPDVTLTSDGGGVVTAARRPVEGADRVARFLAGVAEKQPAGTTLVPVLVNGEPGLTVLDARGATVAVVSLTIADGRVVRVDMVLNPRKLPAGRDE